MYYLTAIISGLSKMPDNAGAHYFHNSLRSRLLAIKNACEELQNECEILKALSPISDDEIIKIVAAPEYFFAPLPDSILLQAGKAEKKQTASFKYLSHAQFLTIRSSLLSLSKLYPDIVIVPGTMPYRKSAIIPNTTAGYPDLTQPENTYENILSLCLKTAQNMRFGIGEKQPLENLLTQLKAALNQLPIDEETDSVSLQVLYETPSDGFKKIQERRRRYYKKPSPIPLYSQDAGDYPRYTVDQKMANRLATSLNDKSVNLSNLIHPITYRSSVIAYWKGEVAYNGTKNLGWDEIDPKILWTNAQYLYSYEPKKKGSAWIANNKFRISHTVFGIEICVDHFIGVLEKQQNVIQIPLDVQLILSDAVLNNKKHRIAEFCIHSASSLTLTGIAHKPSQPNERKFLNVKWIQFSYHDLITKFSKKTPHPSKIYEPNENYYVLLTRSCNNLPIDRIAPICPAFGNRYVLQTLYNEWNAILPDPASGELAYQLQEQ